MSTVRCRLVGGPIESVAVLRRLRQVCAMWGGGGSGSGGGVLTEHETKLLAQSLCSPDVKKKAGCADRAKKPA